MSQHTANDETVQRSAKPHFAPSSVTSSHPIAHATATPRTRLENNARHVEDAHLIQQIRAIEQQVTADDYHQRSCFDCSNFHNPALVAFQRLHSASEQQNNAAVTEHIIQRNAVAAACVSTLSAEGVLTQENTSQQRHESPGPGVANFRSPHSTSQRNQSLLLSSSFAHPPSPESNPTDTGNPKASPSSSDELPAPTPTSMKRRKIMSARYTYSHDELRRLRHCRKSLEARKLGSSAVIVLADDPVAPTPIYVDPNLLFADMFLSKPIMNALHSLDLRRPSPIQQAAIPRGRFGSDIIAHARSGTGKTIAFLIIVLESLLSSKMRKGGFTSVLVLVPTRELADQVATVFRSLSKFINPEPSLLVVKGGTPEAIDEQQLSLLTPHVVVGTPGRVVMLIQKGVFVVDRISLLVLDEADRLAESAFSHSVPEICALLPVRRQTVAFSATFEPWLRDMLLNVMRSPAFFSFPTSSHENDEIDMLRRAILENVRQYKMPISGALDAKLEGVTSFLSATSFKLCILFINDKRYVAKVLMHLKKEGFRTGLMNASLHQSQRDRTILRMKQGKLQVIVASDLLARGLDLEGCDLILQLDVPHKPATYLHRVGRAGRYGRNGSSVLVYNTKSEERNQVVMLEKSLGSKIAVLDSPNAGNRSSVHQQNEMGKPKPNPTRSRGASEALIDEKIERMTDSFRDLPPEDKHNAEDTTPQQMTEGNTEGHKRAGLDEREDAGSAEHGPYDMWDAYASDAYDAGFREAYAEAFRMSCDLQDRMQDLRG